MNQQLGILCLLTSSLFLGAGAAQDNMYYAVTDGTVRALNVDTGAPTATLAANNFAGGIVGAGREIAFDPETRLLWYSATDNTVRSFNVDTLAVGPTIPSNALPGAAIGAARHVYIDYVGRRLLVTMTNGDIPMYNLSDQSPAGTIPSAAFNNAAVTPRHLAADPRSGTMWFAATDGSFRELDMTLMQLTGRTIPFGGLQVGGNPGAFRHMVVDAARNLMLYSVTDGSVASIDMTTFQAGAHTISSTAFAGAIVGAGRIITADNSIALARVIPFGSGCAGTLGVPDLAPQGGSLPKTGGTFNVALSNLPANQRAYLILGLSNTVWFTTGLPMSLTPLGAAGCSLLVSGDFSIQVPNTTGTATLGIPIPPDPSLVGLHVYFQGYVEDPTANLFGVAVSNGLDITIGTR